MEQRAQGTEHRAPCSGRRTLKTQEFSVPNGVLIHNSSIFAAYSPTTLMRVPAATLSESSMLLMKENSSILSCGTP